MVRKIFYIFIFLILNGAVFAQNKALEQANNLYQKKSYAMAIPEYESLLEKEVYPEAMLKLAMSYWKIRKSEDAEKWFEIAALNGGFNRASEYFDPSYIYTYAEVLKFNGKYEAAKERFLEYENISDDSKGALQAKICTVIPAMMQDSTKVELKHYQYNTQFAEFGAQYHDNQMYYVGASEKSANKNMSPYTGEPYLDIMKVKYPGTDSVQAPELLGKTINSKLNEGPLTLSREGDEMIFTRNYYLKGKELRREDGFLGFGLFESALENKKWSEPARLNICEIENNYGHPSLSYNGALLYFVSDMPGGYGGTDIYVSTRLADGWSSPRNLGPAINTQGNESYPYIHLTGTLYFSSDYHQGLGGLDVFSARKNENDSWENIRNLGYPINSSADDFSLVLKADSRSGFFSSNRPGGKGSDDIYLAKLNVPVDELMDIDSLVAAIEAEDQDTSSVTASIEDSQSADSLLATDNQKSARQVMSVEKEALRNSSGGYFEFVYEDGSDELSVEEELRILESMDLENEEKVAEYFGEEEELRSDEEVEKEKEEILAKTKAPEKKSEAAKKDIPVWNDLLTDNGALKSTPTAQEIATQSLEGLVFRIQIGAYRVPVYGGPEKYYNKKNIESYTLRDNVTRYLLPQSFEKIKDAEVYRKSLKDEKMKDAFIVPFFNAQRISMDQALQMLLEN